MAKVTRRVKSALPRWIDKTERRWKSAALAMATDVHRLATIYAPEESGDLISSGRIEKIDKGYKVTFGGGSGVLNVPYARIRHFENKKNPQTLRYLARAGYRVARNKKKYIAGSGLNFDKIKL